MADHYDLEALAENALENAHRPNADHEERMEYVGRAQVYATLAVAAAIRQASAASGDPRR